MENPHSDFNNPNFPKIWLSQQFPIINFVTFAPVVIGVILVVLSFINTQKNS